MKLTGMVFFSALILATGAAAATPFDGAWSVSQICPATNGDVQGYTWNYGAVVRNGVFTAVKLAQSANEGSLRLTGRIQANGEATLTATGKAGRSEFNVGHVAKGYPLHFAVSAHFTGASGTGTRNQQRPCDFTFTKS